MHTAVNDGRLTRPHRTNVDFGVSSTPSLPPSTGKWHPFDIHRMENWYVTIANSINNLATHQLICRLLDFNNDINKTLQEKNISVCNDGDSVLLSAYDDKLYDLNDELVVTRSFYKNIVSNLLNLDNDDSEALDNWLHLDFIVS